MDIAANIVPDAAASMLLYAAATLSANMAGLRLTAATATMRASEDSESDLPTMLEDHDSDSEYTGTFWR